MLKRIYTLIISASLFLVLATSCGEYQKVLKSSDYEYKYKKAKEYYEKGEYVRACDLYRDLVNVYRGTSKADEIYFFYAQSYYESGDYMLAGHWFRTLVNEYPRSSYRKDAQYMIATCYYDESPSIRLDQTVTKKAIDAYQMYVNLFPASDKVIEANEKIDELHDKLVYKSFLTAKLYYDLENYKASTIALENSLKEYPTSRYREELMYMLLRSKYNLGVRSVENLMEQRLSSALDEYYTFVDSYPESKYRKIADKYYEELSKKLDYHNDEI
ncbi:MAG: outer membrane protein assembly factor BamD [Mangrovibacterium sp.]